MARAALAPPQGPPVYAVPLVSSTTALFLIADTGGGHRAAASAVASRIAADGHSLDCHIIDPFAEASPAPIGWTADLYGPLIRRAPWLWGTLYHATNSRAGVAALVSSALRAVRPGIARLATDLDPSVIVSFHPLLNHVTMRALGCPGRRPPVMTVVTDLVDIHASWLCPDVDALVLPTHRALDRALRAGVPPQRCRELGLPVAPPFAAQGGAAGTDREDVRRDARRQLGLPLDGFLVLLCGGADGSGGIASRARSLASLGVHLAVICGRNHRLLAQLGGLVARPPGQATVRGFVTDMPVWMRAANALATRAGPGMIAEALCSALPLLLTSYIPGQERGNIDWVLDAGAGRFVPTVDLLLDAVRDLATPGSHQRQAMEAAAQRAARPHATANIASLVRTLAERGGRGAPPSQ